MYQSTVRSHLLRYTATTALILAANAAQAQSALPTGGTVTSGSATIASDATSTTVTQSSGIAAMTFASFDVAQGNTVRFNQPNATARTLARVTGTTNSTIAGQITATGAVYLVNPNGIAITSTGRVNVGGGFVASTLNLTEANFNLGMLNFAGTGASANVSHAGIITVTGGTNNYVALLGGTVTVASGSSISVPLGKIGIASGETVTLNPSGTFLAVSTPTAAITGGDTALIELAGGIAASGGTVTISAATAADVVRNVVNLAGTGSVSVSSDSLNGGTIQLLGGAGGTMKLRGSLDAQSTSAGGQIFTTAATLDFRGASITAAGQNAPGSWFAGASSLAIDAASASTVSNTLSRTNVTLRTTNAPAIQNTPRGITIDGAITWTSANRLELTSFENIAINAAITSGSTSTLILNAGNNVALTGAITTGAAGTIGVGTFNLANGNWSQVGTLPAFSVRDFQFDTTKASFLRATGGSGNGISPYRIADVYGLAGIASTSLLASTFALANDIDATGTVNWNSGAGFVSIGRNTAFTGGLSGMNTATIGARFAIDGLYINNSVVGGLFRSLAGGVSDLNLTNASMETPFNGGGLLAGSLSAGGTITRVTVGGTRTGGAANIGGLVGDSTGGIMTDVRSTATVNGGTSSSVGGLVGLMTGGRITRGTASGTITGTGSAIGGLVGQATGGGTVTTSSASGNVTGGNNVGGLIGSMFALSNNVVTNIDNSFAIGNVSGVNSVGGLVGVQQAIDGGRATITATTAGATYATGNVSATGTAVGGLVGQMTTDTVAGTTASIAGAFATGTVGSTGPFSASYVGGLVGAATKNGTSTTLSIGNSYATGAVTSAGGQVGGLIGAATGTMTVTDSYAGIGAVSGGAASVGGLIGSAAGGVTISDARTTGPATASGNVTGTGSSVGGLVGNMNYGSVTGARASGTVQGLGAVGGLIGFSSNGTASQNMTITNSSATGNVTGSSNNVGGLVGTFTKTNAGISSITGSFATGIVRSTLQVGGLVGLLTAGSGTTPGVATVTNSYATGAVTATNTGSAAVGGLIGLASASGSGSGTRISVSGSYATGNVAAPNAAIGTSYVGGLIGQASMSVNANLTLDLSDVYATGNVSSIGGYVGGLIGGMLGLSTRTTLARGYATGSVSGTSDVGGLIGYVANVGLNSVYATGRVAASASRIGGLVGYQVNGSIINYAYATGAVSTTSTGSTDLGGLIGLSDNAANRLNNAYASGAVSSGGGVAGGLIGQLAGNGNLVTNVYATGSVNAASDVGGLVGLLGNGTTVNGAWASGAVSSGDSGPGGGLGGRTTGGVFTNAYWDSYSTGQANAFRAGTDAGATVTAVTSDPAQAGAANYAFNPAAYANLPAATNLGGTTVTGFALMVGGVRPFLAFEVPLAGNSFVTTVGGAQTIANAHQLQLIGYNATTYAANYRLAGLVNLAETGQVANGIVGSSTAAGTAYAAAAAGSAASYAGMWAATGFVSLGTNGAGLTWDGTTYRSIGTITSGTYGFSGTLTGAIADSPNGALSNLFINRVGINNTGLFGTLSGTVTNLTLTGVNVTGGNGTGALAGMTIGGPVNSDVGTAPTVILVSAAGRVTGAQVAGGLIGSANRRTIVRAGAFTGAVTGTNTVGGLVGYTNRAAVDGFTSGSVTGQSYVGGVVGYQLLGNSVGGSRSTVNGTLAVGGVVGVVDGGTAGATSIGNTVNGPSSEDRNFGRVQNGGTVRSPTP